MNLIDFHVTEIISEDRNTIYKLMGINLQQVNDETEEWYREYLLSEGIKQTYKYWDDGGENIRTSIFKVGRDTPYYPGYVGQH